MERCSESAPEHCIFPLLIWQRRKPCGVRLLDFLRILLQVKNTPVEALAAASIRQMYQLRQADRQWLVNVGRQLSVLLKDDYDRLRYILSQIHISP